MRKVLLFGLLIIGCWLLAGAANAVCPVCTIAVGAGLEGMRLLGVDDVITGIWAGGFILILVFWTAKFMSARGVKNGFWYLLMFLFYYVVLACVYFMPGITFGANTLWGIDKFALGAVVGTIVLYAAEKWNAKLIRANGGKSRFMFQKVIMPTGALLVASAVFAAIVYL